MTKHLINCESVPFDIKDSIVDGFIKKVEADEDKEQPDSGQHGATHPKIGVSQAPGKREPVEIEHKTSHQHDE